MSHPGICGCRGRECLPGGSGGRPWPRTSRRGLGRLQGCPLDWHLSGAKHMSSLARDLDWWPSRDFAAPGFNKDRHTEPSKNRRDEPTFTDPELRRARTSGWGSFCERLLTHLPTTTFTPLGTHLSKALAYDFSVFCAPYLPSGTILGFVPAHASTNRGFAGLGSLLGSFYCLRGVACLTPGGC